VIVKQYSISEMRSEGTLCEAFMLNVSFIGTCMKWDSNRNLQADLWDVVGFFEFFV